MATKPEPVPDCVWLGLKLLWLAWMCFLVVLVQRIQRWRAYEASEPQQHPCECVEGSSTPNRPKEP